MPPIRFAVRQAVKTRARRLATVLTEWADDSPWHPPARGSIDSMANMVRRRKPRRFDDLDKFDSFVDEVTARYTGVWFDLTAGGHEGTYSGAKLKAEIERASRGAAQNLRFLGISAVWFRSAETVSEPGGEEKVRYWSLQMSSAPHDPGGAAIKLYGPTSGPDDNDYASTVPYIVDTHTVPLTRRERRAGAALVVPRRVPDVMQDERESKVTTRAARIGGLFGIAAGFASGVGGAVVVQWAGG